MLSLPSPNCVIPNSKLSIDSVGRGVVFEFFQLLSAFLLHFYYFFFKISDFG